MTFNRTQHAKDIGMKKGETRNTKGNSKVRVRKSKLRILAEKLQEREDIALAIIDRSLKEEKVDNEVVGSAKWVINSIVSVTKAASAEELGNFNSRLKGKREEDEPEEQSLQEIQQESKARLSLVYEAPDEDE